MDLHTMPLAKHRFCLLQKNQILKLCVHSWRNGWLVDSKMFKQAFEWIYIVLDVCMHAAVRETLN